MPWLTVAGRPVTIKRRACSLTAVQFEIKCALVNVKFIVSYCDSDILVNELLINVFSLFRVRKYSMIVHLHNVYYFLGKFNPDRFSRLVVEKYEESYFRFYNKKNKYHKISSW